MPIDVEKAVGAEFAPTSYSWEDKDVILYHLGIGAGNPPTDGTELRYTYEGDLVVLPSFGTIPPFGTMMSLGAVDGVDINLTQILHGEQEIEVHKTIPTSGSVSQSGRVTGIYDKGKGALIVMEIVSVDDKSGEPMFTNRSSIFVRGEGGYGGDTGPSNSRTPPDREPDHVVTSPTMPQQALLYRMSSGDLNPLHADPGFAKFAGFDRPILSMACAPTGLSSRRWLMPASTGIRAVSPRILPDSLVLFTPEILCLPGFGRRTRAGLSPLSPRVTR